MRCEIKTTCVKLCICNASEPLCCRFHHMHQIRNISLTTEGENIAVSSWKVTRTCIFQYISLTIISTYLWVTPQGLLSSCWTTSRIYVLTIARHSCSTSCSRNWEGRLPPSLGLWVFMCVHTNGLLLVSSFGVGVLLGVHASFVMFLLSPVTW